MLTSNQLPRKIQQWLSRMLLLFAQVPLVFFFLNGFSHSLIPLFYPLSTLTDKKDYTFRSFWDREECYRILITFLEKFRQGGGRIELSVPRTNSDAPLPNDSSSSPTAAGHSSVKLTASSANTSTASSQAQEPTSNAGVSNKRASVTVPRPVSQIMDSTTISNALAAGNGNNDDVLDSGE
jgi:hypothetical protein